jgi:acylphosphatase
MLQMTLIIKGTVQKVGFRYSVVEYVNSQHLAIVGNVRNLPDGSVKVIAQGELTALRELYSFCTKGPPRAEVREVQEDVVQIQRTEYSDFALCAE